MPSPGLSIDVEMVLPSGIEPPTPSLPRTWAPRVLHTNLCGCACAITPEDPGECCASRSLAPRALALGVVGGGEADGAGEAGAALGLERDFDFCPVAGVLGADVAEGERAAEVPAGLGGGELADGGALGAAADLVAGRRHRREVREL